MELEFKIFTSVFWACYIMAIRSLRAYRSNNEIDSQTFNNTESTYNFTVRWFNLIIILASVNTVLIWFDENIYKYFLPFWYLDTIQFKVAGILVCLSSIIWTAAVYNNAIKLMLLNEDKQISRFTRYGVFRYSRNPTLLGVLLNLVGIFCLAPNALSLLAMACGFLIMQIQIRLEEDMFLKKYGQEYSNFQKRTKRWI